MAPQPTIVGGMVSELLFLKRSALIDAAFEQAKQSYGAKPDGDQRPGTFLIHVIHFIGPFVSMQERYFYYTSRIFLVNLNQSLSLS